MRSYGRTGGGGLKARPDEEGDGELLALECSGHGLIDRSAFKYRAGWFEVCNNVSQAMQSVDGRGGHFQTPQASYRVGIEWASQGLQWSGDKRYAFDATQW